MAKPSYKELEERLRTCESILAGYESGKNDRKNMEIDVNKLASIIKHSQNFIGLADLSGNVLYLNDAGKKLVGLNEKDIVHTNVFDFVPDSCKAKLRDEVMAVIRKDGVWCGEAPLCNLMSGEICEMECTVIEVAEDRNPPYLAAVMQNITERKRAEQALRQSEEKYRRLVEGLPDIIYIVDSRKGGTYWSNHVDEVLGFTADDRLKNPNVWRASIHPEDLDHVDSIIREAASGKKFDIEYRARDKKGNWHWLNDRSIDIRSEADGVIVEGIARDITVHKKNGEQTRIFADLVDASPSSITVHDISGKFLYINRKTLEMHGYTHDEMLSMNVQDLETPESARLIAPRIKELMENGEASFEVEHFRKDGSTIPLRIEAKFAKWHGNDVVQSIGVDMTERRRAEEELKKYQLAVESTADLIAVIDKDCRFTMVNDNYARYQGRDKKDIIGRYAAEIVGEHLFNAVMKPQLTRVLAGEVVNYTMEREYPALGNRFLEVSYYPLRNDDEHINGIVADITDITDWKKSEEDKRKFEEQLLRVQKLESIGRLAGGVAHDFNNILVGIMGYAELLALHYPDESSMEGEAAHAIFKNAERAADLTRQLLGFARKGKYNPVPLDINEVILNVLIVSEKIFEKKIRIRNDLDRQLNPALMDLHQCEQVLTNLIINARDAMPTGGDLTISTRNAPSAENVSCRFCAKVKPGSYVVVSVSDTGVGISEDNIPRIIEPFFTTKGEGKGTGLGLATVYGIIKNHGGHLDIKSRQGIGSTFTFFVPAAEQNEMPAKAEPKLVKGKAVILLVDDEENVRMLMARILERLGYYVIMASNGKEAIEIVTKQFGIIDLVVLDLIMPVLDGKEAFFAMKKIYPPMKIIVSSGYSRDDHAAELMKEGACGFLQKPFQMHALADAIAGALTK